MTDSIKPPKLATLMLRLFASEPDFPQIVGDLSEEFHNHLLTSGPDAARRSYWREAIRNLWVLAKRLSTIRVLAVAGLSFGIWIFSLWPFTQWLNNRPEGYNSLFGHLLTLYLYVGTISLALGVLMSLFLRGRERMLRLAFTGFYLLFLICLQVISPIPVFGKYYIYNVINWSLTLGAFWMGSWWIGRRRLRRLAGPTVR